MKPIIYVLVNKGLLILFALLMLQSCKYYEPILKSDVTNRPEILNELKGKALIIHGKRGIYFLANPTIDTGRQEISGLLSSVPPEHSTYINDAKQKYRYQPQTSKVIGEVHLYAPIDTLPDRGNVVAIPLSAVERMEMIKPDKMRNTLTVVGCVLLAYLVIVTIYVIVNPVPGI